MPRKNFSSDQCQIMARRIAGVFRLQSGTIRYQDESELLEILIRCARPLAGKKRKSPIHRQLVTQVYERMVTDDRIHIGPVAASMSQSFMDSQCDISRALRERSRRDDLRRRRQEVLVVLTA